MHLFASRRSERHAQARRITAGPIPVRHARIEREHSELPRSRKPREYLDAHTSTTRNPCLYLGAPANTALLRLSGRHGAARGAIR